MIATENLPEIRRAVPALIALAANVRPDWNETELQSAIVAAATAGWEWPRVLVEVVRLLVDPNGSPRDLREASRDPLKLSRSPAPGAEIRGAELARRAMRGEEVP
ncbi:hypothetical protein ABZ897_00590 [Nonomuraea sp. NPDC046802]|uniref:hypothetical protein n=1 Tax=Nonomuraea sp. NPDC046802 TaxID=3154919 RepID=UPI0033CEE523